MKKVSYLLKLLHHIIGGIKLIQCKKIVPFKHKQTPDTKSVMCVCDLSNYIYSALKRSCATIPKEVELLL